MTATTAPIMNQALRDSSMPTGHLPAGAAAARSGDRAKGSSVSGHHDPIPGGALAAGQATQAPVMPTTAEPSWSTSLFPVKSRAH